MPSPSTRSSVSSARAASAFRSNSAKRLIEKSRSSLGVSHVVRVSVGVAGASVLVDDLLVGESPLSKPLTMSTGRRKLTIQKKGHIPVTQRIDVAGGDNLELSFDLTPIEQKPSQASTSKLPPPTREPTMEPDRGMGTPFWVSLAATGVFAAGSGACGLLALNAESDNDDQLNSSNASKSELEDSKSKTERYALGTDILLGATLLAGGLTVYFALDSDDESSTKVGFTPAGASVSGQF